MILDNKGKMFEERRKENKPVKAGRRAEDKLAKKEETKKNKGITLIALVITIIVMLILVAVTINLAVNGGLFGYAKNASEQTQLALDEENKLDSQAAEIIADQTEVSTSVKNPYKNENFTKAWTCTEGTWTEEEITDNSVILTGDVVAKLYEKDGGYHLVLEKIGERGQIGCPEVRASINSIKVAKTNNVMNDSSKRLLIAARSKSS